MGAAREAAKDRSGAASDCGTAGCCRRFIALEDGLPSRLRDATAIGERFSKAVAMRRRSNRCASRAGSA